MKRILSRPYAALLGVALCAALASPRAAAQATFSIDYESSSIGFLNPCTGIALTEADILSPSGIVPLFGPLLPPCIATTGGAGGLNLANHAGCVGHPPGTGCKLEVDALSYGVDARTLPAAPPVRWYFSVDEHALGGPPASPPPNVTSEGAGGAREAAADMFTTHGLPLGPLPPFAVGGFGPNAGVLDGNGLISISGQTYKGVGLLEPNAPALTPHEGDNLDAFDFGPVPALGAIYFSLDSGFVDPLTLLPNTSGALSHGFVGGDVLISGPFAVLPAVYAPAALLGLDFFGPDTDDLDALILSENGLPGYQASLMPFDWAPFAPGPKDMLLFSVRRGSAVIGAPDSIFGIPIEEGDILTRPLAGGVSPFPGIFIAAENLGLLTRRSTGVAFADEVDALDSLATPILDCNATGLEDILDIQTAGFVDCNFNGSPDACDILLGLSNDANGSGVPDECERGLPVPYCVAKVSSLGVTCVPFIDSEGTASVTSPKPFDVKGGNILNFVNGLLFYGYGAAAIPFSGGTLCVAPPLRRLPIMNSGGVLPIRNCSGSYTFDFNAHIQSGVDPLLVPGAAVFGQWWFRDTPNTFGIGLSNALAFVVCP